MVDCRVCVCLCVCGGGGEWDGVIRYNSPQSIGYGGGVGVAALSPTAIHPLKSDSESDENMPPPSRAQ